MIYTTEVENMCPVAKGAKHEPAPIPEEGQWVHAKKIEDISGCLLYTSPSPRDGLLSRMTSSA